MGADLLSVLGAENLMGVIEEVKGGVPDDLLPAPFMTPTRTVIGDQGSYYKTSRTRKNAKVTNYGGTSSEVTQQGISEVPVKLIHSYENMRHGPKLFQLLENPEDGTKQQLARQEITRQTVNLAQRCMNLRMSAIYSMLAFGEIYVNTDGGLATTTGSAYDIDFGVPANNKNQLNGIIGASWDTATTDIIGDILAIKEQARKLTGMPIRHCFYGVNVPNYIAKNNTAKEYLARNGGAQTAFIGGEIPNGFMGIQWHPVYEAFYENTSDTNTDFFGGDACVFTPDPSPDWYELVEGTFPVPRLSGVVGDSVEDALGNLTQTPGMFSYAEIGSNPPSIVQYYGDTFLPILKNPNAIFIADVTP